MISKFEASSDQVDKLLRLKKSMEAQESEKIEAANDRVVELVQLFAEASLLAAGFHTHRGRG